jgi:hypothetical protein
MEKGLAQGAIEVSSEDGGVANACMMSHVPQDSISLKRRGYLGVSLDQRRDR